MKHKQRSRVDPKNPFAIRELSSEPSEPSPRMTLRPMWTTFSLGKAPTSTVPRSPTGPSTRICSRPSSSSTYRASMLARQKRYQPRDRHRSSAACASRPKTSPTRCGRHRFSGGPSGCSTQGDAPGVHQGRRPQGRLRHDRDARRVLAAARRDRATGRRGAVGCPGVHRHWYLSPWGHKDSRFSGHITG